MIDRGEQNGDMPITSIIRRRVQEGHEANFEEWCRGIDAAGNRFSGYQGIKLIHPEHAGDEYVTIISFDSYNHYLADGIHFSAIKTTNRTSLAAKEIRVHLLDQTVLI